MTSLTEKLTHPDVRPKVVAACVGLVEDEVAAKRGLSGAAIKAGFRVIKGLKPGMIAGTVNSLLPDFAGAMQPLYDKATDGAPDAKAAFTDFLRNNTSEVADALLSVTDEKAQRAGNSIIKKTYDRLRGSARDNVQHAVPGLARALGPFL